MLEKDLVLRNVSKRYGDKLVVDGVDLTINKGDFLTILGPSGGGKTTVLKMISGFESISSGDIFLDGKQSVRFRRIKEILECYFRTMHYFLI